METQITIKIDAKEIARLQGISIESAEEYVKDQLYKFKKALDGVITDFYFNELD